MKIDKVFLLLSFCISALAGYGFYWLNSDELYRLLIAIFSGVNIFITLSGLLALKGKKGGLVGNIKVVSGIFLIVTVIINVIFTVINFTHPAAYIISSGVDLLVYIIVSYSIKRALD